jgi:hypothetical protein
VPGTYDPQKCIHHHFAQQQLAQAHVRFGSKTDIRARLSNVCFTPKSGHAVYSPPKLEIEQASSPNCRRPLRTCVQRQKLIPARVPACAWDVFLAIDLSWRELVALPRRDTRSKTSQTIRRRPDE